MFNHHGSTTGRDIVKSLEESDRDIKDISRTDLGRFGPEFVCHEKRITVGWFAYGKNDCFRTWDYFPVLVFVHADGREQEVG